MKKEDLMLPGIENRNWSSAINQVRSIPVLVANAIQGEKALGVRLRVFEVPVPIVLAALGPA
jgi:hypothetical protein